MSEIPDRSCVSSNGTFVNVPVKAVPGCPDLNITAIGANVPIGYVSGAPLNKIGNYWTANLSWVDFAQPNYTVKLEAYDSGGWKSNDYSFTVDFTHGYLAPIQSSLYPIGALAPTNGFYLLGCLFTFKVKNPTDTAYIRIYSASTNQQVLSIDSSDTNFVLTQSSYLSFKIKVTDLPIGDYYILFDYGKSERQRSKFQILYKKTATFKNLFKKIVI